jgi:hypothetical protein
LSKRSVIHLIVSLTLLISIFLVLPGVFLHRLGQEVLTFPTQHKNTFSPEALKSFRQKHLILQKDFLIDTITYTQAELAAGCFEKIYTGNNQAVLNPQLTILPKGITISATVYLISIPTPWPLNRLLESRFPVKNDRIALYSRITVENQVIVEDQRPILRPRRIHMGKKELPHELLFLGKKLIPSIFTKGLSDSIDRVVLKKGEMELYKAKAQEPSEDSL